MPGILSSFSPDVFEFPPDPGDIEMLVHQPDPDPLIVAMEYLYGTPNAPEPSLEAARAHSVAEEVRGPFEKLAQVCRLRPEADISPYLIALDQVLENVNKMRLYADCEQLEAADLLLKVLNCEHPEIAKGACDVLTQICSREPDCKELFTTRALIQRLLSIIDRNKDDEFVAKALDAAIAILSDNLDGLEVLQYYAGLSVLLYVLIRDKADWTVKIISYLCEMCDRERQLRLTLISQDYIPALVKLVAKERTGSHLHLLKLLAILVEEDYDSLDELARSKLDVKEVLNRLVESSVGRPELDAERVASLWLLRDIHNLELGKSVFDRD